MSTEKKTRECLSRGKLTPNGDSVRTTVPKAAVENDPVLSEDSPVLWFKEGDGRIVIEPVEQPLPDPAEDE